MKHEEPVVHNTERPRSPGSLIVLVSGLAGTLLFFAHAAFVPIALAILFALLLSGPVEALNRRGLPRTVSALLILIIFLTIVTTTVDLLWTPAQSWLAAAPVQRSAGTTRRSP
jgi:predicted PurR-regulated permease PerM